MRFRKRIFPFALSVLLVFSLLIPVAYASNPVVSEGKLFWDWLSLKPYRDWFSSCLGSGVTSDTATSEDWQTAYNKKVQSLPATGVTSGGGLVWYPHVSYAYLDCYISSSGYKGLTIIPDGTGSGSLNNEFNSVISFNSSSVSVSALYKSSGEYNFQRFKYSFVVDDLCPLSGQYKQGQLYLSGQCVNNASESRSFVADFPGESVSTYCAKGVSFSRNPSISSETEQYSCVSFVAACSMPFYEIVPVDAIVSPTTGNYIIDSRVGSITGDFGVMGDNNTLIKSDKNYIVNETDNSVYNPVTNTTSTMTSWDYDYSTRSYNVTLDGGTKQTITYGDEKITIQEGDTVYNVYYLAQDGGTTDPTESPSPTDPAGDGDSIWDKLGNLLGSLLGGVVDLANRVLGKVLDALTSLVTMLTDRIGVLVEAVLGIFEKLPTMFTGFLGLVAALFPFLPQELIVVLEFGLIASVFVGLFLLIFRR